MEESDRTKAIKQEKLKLTRELKRAKISKHKMKAFESVIENVAVMKVKLDELKERIVFEDFLIKYDNGGGQTGIRENPVFKRYESLFKTFMLGMGRILDAIPDEDAVEEQEKIAGFQPQTVLDMVREKHKEA